MNYKALQYVCIISRIRLTIPGTNVLLYVDKILHTFSRTTDFDDLSFCSEYLLKRGIKVGIIDAFE